MTVFLLNDADGLGDGDIDVFGAMGDLIVAANDTGIGFDEVVDGKIRVTYAPTENGPTHQRLDSLINTAFTPDYGDGPQDVDIVVVAVPDNFVLGDGSFGVTNNGTALAPAGSGLAGADLNTTTDCLVLYDGQLEICVARDGTGGTLDLAVPGPVVLYHEFSHAFRIVTDALLDLGRTCNPSSDEENAAILDENDMRTMLADLIGEAPILRDPGIHCGGQCGGTASVGGCCIVASVVSGSPRSSQVQRLRAVRDQFVRRSETGFHFFEWLHRDYYAFSPQVSVLVADDLDLRQVVLDGYVEPLLDFWSFMVARTEIDPSSPVAVGDAFAASVPDDPDQLQLRRLTLQLVADHLDPLAAEGADDPLSQLLRERAWTSEIIRWALIEPMAIYATALDELLAGRPVGPTLVAHLEPWVTRLPIHPVWGALASDKIDGELAMCDLLLGTDEARNGFRHRLRRRFPTATAIQRIGAAATGSGPGTDDEEVGHGR